MFAPRLLVAGECWEYQGHRVHNYGRTMRQGRHVLIHRLALSLHLGRPLAGNALHRCDNPPCFRPTHLYEGTTQQNIADRGSRGRTAVGERASKAKLTADEVRALRADRQAGMTYRQLAARYGVTHQAARAVALRRVWRSI